METYGLKIPEDVRALFTEYAIENKIREKQKLEAIRKKEIRLAKDMLDGMTINYKKYKNTGLYIEAPKTLTPILRAILKANGVEFYDHNKEYRIV